MSEPAAGDSTGTRRVIIADDSDDMRALVRLVLLTASYTVVCEAPDGDVAVRCWEHHRSPELFAVVLDQRMPGLTGLEVAERILRDDPEQRVILFSAGLTDEIRRQAEAVGVTACLTKDEVMELPTHAAMRG
ncbi:MAG: two-component system, OmpR family, response regulator [Acidimicrobiaceae bacterium]|jgi:CheY-like chemotaxis protein